MQLKDKTAIITGGGSGFGASMAELFAKNGAKVSVADINLDNAKKVATQMGISSRSRCWKLSKR